MDSSPGGPTLPRFISDLTRLLQDLGQALTKNPNSDSAEIPDDLKRVKDSLEKSVRFYEYIARYQEQHPHLRLQRISFSSLTWKHLNDLGVVCYCWPTSLFVERLEALCDVANAQSQQESLTHTGMFDLFWEAKSQGLVEYLRLVTKFYSNVTEAGARVLTDPILTQVGELLKEKLSRKPYIFLEFVLASISDLPVIIPHGSKATILTGKVDYAFFALLQSFNFNVEDFIPSFKSFLNQSSLDDLLKLPGISEIILRDDLIKCTLIEEKREELGGRHLEDAVPQITGETITVIEKTGRTRIPWCLSNGVEWLFGIVEKAGEESFYCYRICNPIALDRNFHDLESLRLVMKTLMVWMDTPVEDLSPLFKPVL